MLLLKKDLFARMVLSAHKDKSLNKKFRVSHVDTWDKYPVSNYGTEAEDNRDNVFNEKLNVIPLVKSKPISVKLVSPPERIDEKVSNIIDNPHLAQIKAELEFAEALLKKIKILDANNLKIAVIEETISRLKDQLEQKSYV